MDLKGKEIFLNQTYFLVDFFPPEEKSHIWPLA